MANEGVIIKFRVQDDGTLILIRQAEDNLKDLGHVARETSGGGLADMTHGAMDLNASLGMMKTALAEAGGIVGELNDLGVVSLRTKAGLDSLTDGKAQSWAESTGKAVHGLVDDTDLMHAAMEGLSSQSIQTQGQMNELARIGSILGLTFKNDAAGGIEVLIKALETPGMTRPLKELGIDITKVKDEYDRLKETMGEKPAWMQAIFDVAGAAADKLGDKILSGPGTAMEKLSVQWANLKESVGEKIAVGIEVWLTDVPADVRTIIDWAETHHAANVTAAQTAPAGTGPNGLPPSVTPSQAGEVTGRLEQQQVLDAQAAASQKLMDASDKLFAADAIARRGAPSVGGAGRTDQFLQGQADIATNYQLMIDAWAEKRGRSTGASASQLDPAFIADRTRRESGLGGGVITGEQDFWRAIHLGAQTVVNGFQDVTGAARNIAMGFRDAAMAAQRYSTAASAFGLTSGGIAGEATGDLQQSLDTRRMIAMKQGPKQLAGFDQEATHWMEQYKIATGQATAESLIFDKAQQSIFDGIASGKMKMQVGEAGLLALAKAAAAGHTDMKSLYTIMQQMNDTTMRRQGMLGLLNLANDDPGMLLRGGLDDRGGAVSKQPIKPGAPTAEDPYSALVISAGKATKAIGEGLLGSMQNLANLAPKQGAAMAGGLEAALPSIEKLKIQLGFVSKLLAGLSGEMRITWEMVSGGGDSGGRAPTTGGGGYGGRGR